MVNSAPVAGFTHALTRAREGVPSTTLPRTSVPHQVPGIVRTPFGR